MITPVSNQIEQYNRQTKEKHNRKYINRENSKNETMFEFELKTKINLKLKIQNSLNEIGKVRSMKTLIKERTFCIKCDLKRLKLINVSRKLQCLPNFSSFVVVFHYTYMRYPHSTTVRNSYRCWFFLNMVLFKKVLH